ncbi:uncharacterized protein LOC131931331 [Physella acuta]|uniref:uncharacterized protein LOC131931331 n=1 Tax=Physella acuta TaxID=109671 RepID=UPI0027DB08A8|nr:uncharacterized protein LOC131931331 [Physella acuta]
MAVLNNWKVYSKDGLIFLCLLLWSCSLLAPSLASCLRPEPCTVDERFQPLTCECVPCQKGYVQPSELHRNEFCIPSQTRDAELNSGNILKIWFTSFSRMMPFVISVLHLFSGLY